MATERIHQQGSLASLRRLPSRKLSARYTTKPPPRMPEFEMIKPPSQVESVVIAVMETRPQEQSMEETAEQTETPTAPPVVRSSNAKSTRIRPQPPPLAIPSKARLPQQRAVPDSPPALSQLPPPPERAPSAADVPLPQSGNGKTSPDSKSEDVAPPEVTPVMRSMFPTYDHSLPLSHQEYLPNTNNLAESAYSRPPVAATSNNPYRNHMLTGSRPSSTIVADTRESPLRQSESLKRGNPVSTSEQLMGMWDISNGQAYQDAAETYTLELSW